MSQQIEKLADATDPGLEYAYKEYEDFAKEFDGESDRAAVVLAAAKIEAQLECILKSVLKPTASNDDDLFNNNGPLSTFSSKIILCHRLGLIDDYFAYSLNILRKIRNNMAHETNAKLDSEKDRIDQMVKVMKNQNFFKTILKSHYKGKINISNLLKAAVIFMIVQLQYGNEVSMTIKPPFTINLN